VAYKEQTMIDSELVRAYTIINTQADADMDYDELFFLLTACGISEGTAHVVCLDMGRVPA
jgi:hypothetical protein